LPIKQLFIIAILISMITMGKEISQPPSEKTFSSCQTKIHEIKEQINKIQNKKESLSFLGKKYKEVVGEMSNNKVWRYDICSVPGYQFSSEVDQVDLEGLFAKDVKQIIFISFAEDNRTIQSKSLYYLDKNKNIHEMKFIANEIYENTISLNE